MNLLIDIHTHLDHPILINKIDEIVNRAKNAGLKHIITNGINPDTNRKCLELSKKYDIIRCAMGIYPRSALKKEIENSEYKIDLIDFDFDEEINFIRKNKDNIVAISEVGLDFVNGEDKQQIEDFEKMVKLAEELKKPIVVHSRKAELKCVEMLESSKNKKIVMHCFCGKKSLVKRVADNGWFLTTPTIVVRSQQFQDIVRNVSISQLFCETDSPYLSPYKGVEREHAVICEAREETRSPNRSHAGQWNEPAYVIESYNKIAEIKQMDISEVVNNIYMNWQRVFE